MSVDDTGMVPVSDDELRMVQGGSIWGRIKKAAGWVKDHVVATAKSIGVKFKF